VPRELFQFECHLVRRLTTWALECNGKDTGAPW